MVALGTTAPLTSLIVPLIEELEFWVNAAAAKKIQNRNKKKTL
jgi:hypothetical protein